MVESVIAQRQPGVVFNCASYNAVDRAETERSLARHANAQGAQNLAIACGRHGAEFVHLSTNYVFDGALDRPYVEADEPSPISAYGNSKRAGENLALEFGRHVLIIRSAAIFGGPRSFPMRILERARSGDALRVVSDQTINPTYAKDLAAVSLKLAEEGVAGIVHAVNGGCCAWDELARATLAEAGIDRSVESVPTGAYPAAAPRPKNGCLASSRIPALRPWREALHEALNP